MAYAMTKRGSLDNQPASEFMCDTAADLATIDPSLITLGSVALVVEDMEVFIANSQKQWKSMTPAEKEEEETEPAGGEG